MILYQCILKDLRTHFSYQCIPKGLSASADVLGEFAFPKDLRGRAQRSPAWRQNRLAQRSGSHALTWLGPRVHSQEPKVQSLGRAYVPLRAKRLCSRIFVAQRLRIRKALGSMTGITLHATTKQVERLRALRIFFRENQAFEKKAEEGLMRIDATGEEPNRKENLQAVRKESENPHP